MAGANQRILVDCIQQPDILLEWRIVCIQQTIHIPSDITIEEIRLHLIDTHPLIFEIMTILLEQSLIVYHHPANNGGGILFVEFSQQ